ncbi:MAG TPA: thiol reductant ABC exporter subunit CydD, partial [Firmicutes bacterium]|nr:thiol reductant ABC exporter subunit CydD [Bacillota bacterium]
ERLTALGPVFAAGERRGELVTALTEGVDALEPYLARYLPQLALTALVPLLILGFVFPADRLSGFLLLLTAPLLPLFMALIGRETERLSERQWATLGRLGAHFLDVLQGLDTLKLFGRSREQAAVIAQASQDFHAATLRVLRVAFLSALALELLASLSTALVAVTLGLRLLAGRLPFGRALFVLLLVPEFYAPFRLLASRFHAGLAGASASRRLSALLASATAPDGSLPTDSADLRRGTALSLTLEDVHFAYDGGTRPALSGVSFVLRPGERVALVGPSGAGKSTLLRLILRFLRPDRGWILVDGRPLSEIPAGEWYRQVALVPQEPHLFYGTAAENLRLAAPGASDTELRAAAKLAGADEFLRRLPQGYDTLLGERGLRLSGGEAQRLALARAFLKDAPLLLLDEPAAGLDPESEALVQEALARLGAGRTVLAVAHRLSTAAQADRIVVLDGGRVVEEGRHSDLLAQNGLYARLARAWWGAG